MQHCFITHSRQQQTIISSFKDIENLLYFTEYLQEGTWREEAFYEKSLSRFSTYFCKDHQLKYPKTLWKQNVYTSSQSFSNCRLIR